MKSLKLLNSETFEQLQYSSFHTSRSLESEYYNNLGCVYFALGNFCSASINFKKSLPCNFLPQKLHSVLFNHGLTFMKMSKPKQALDYFKASIQYMSYNHWLVYLRMAECCLLLFQEKFVQHRESSGVKILQLGRRMYQLNQR